MHYRFWGLLDSCLAAQVISLGDALKNVSGVVVASQGNTGNYTATNEGTDKNITLRGFSSTTTLRNGFRIQGGANRNMSNVESVEVLKGPAAILYGLVEPGGMVNVVTKQPQETSYYAMNQQFGSYDNYRTTIDATGPIADNKDILYRMNMAYESKGSYQNYVGSEDSTFRVNFDLHRAGGLWTWAMLFVFAWSSVLLNLGTQVYIPVMQQLFEMLDYKAFPIPDLQQPRPEPAIAFRTAYQTSHRLMAEQALQKGF
jgi:outer membrane receptor protein involved in Fe transport